MNASVVSVHHMTHMSTTRSSISYFSEKKKSVDSFGYFPTQKQSKDCSFGWVDCSTRDRATIYSFQVLAQLNGEEWPAPLRALHAVTTVLVSLLCSDLQN